MTREEALEYRKRQPMPGADNRAVSTIFNIIDMYESLLARCRPWLFKVSDSTISEFGAADGFKQLLNDIAEVPDNAKD